MTKFEPKKRLEKVVVSGSVVEYIRYVNPIPVEHLDGVHVRSGEKTEKLDYNLIRARQDIRRVIWCNQTKYSKFVTLTYGDTNLDYDKLLYDFKQFIKKLRRRGYNCPYVWVSEHQKERGIKEGNDGSLHVHAVLFTDEYIANNVISECWGLGFTKINSIKHVKNLAAYVCKYLTKEEFNLYNKHSYHISRGLKKPEIFTNDGYVGDYICFEYPDFFDKVEFNYSGTSEFSFIGADGQRISNSIIYKQGIIQHEKK